MIADVLTKKIETRKAHLNAMILNRAVAEAEIRAYEDVLASLGETEETESPQHNDVEKAPTPERPARRGRKLFSGGWDKILWAAAEQGESQFGMDALNHAATLIGRNISRVQIRGQIAEYAKSGLVERTSPGQYRLSQIAIDALSAASAPESESESERRARRPNRPPLPNATLLHYGKDSEGVQYGPDHLPCRPGTARHGQFAKFEEGMTVGELHDVKGVPHALINMYVDSGWIVPTRFEPMGATIAPPDNDEPDEESQAAE